MGFFYRPRLRLCMTAIVRLSCINQYPCNTGTACSCWWSQRAASKVCPADYSSSCEKNLKQFIMPWIIPRNFDSAWTLGFPRRHNLITPNPSVPRCKDRGEWCSSCHTVWFRVAKYSARSPLKPRTEGFPWALTKTLRMKWSGKLSLFEMGHYVCMWGCLLKSLVCCQPPPLSSIALSLFFFSLIWEENVSCLQRQYDRLDTANLSLHVKTCQWHLTERKGMSDQKRFQIWEVGGKKQLKGGGKRHFNLKCSHWIIFNIHIGFCF